MNCTKCGAPLPENAAFCANCGAECQPPVQAQPVQTQYVYAQPPVQQNNSRYGMAIAAMVLGIVSACTCWVGVPLAIVGLILGILGLKTPKGKGMAIAGIVISAVVLAIWLTLLLIGLFAVGAAHDFPYYYYYS